MRVDEIYVGSLRASALEGRAHVVTIKGGELRKNEKEQRRILIQLEELPGNFWLNATNARKIAEIHGQEAKLWVGKQIEIYPTTTQMQGQEVACIRVRKAPEQTPAAALGVEVGNETGGRDGKPIMRF